MTVTWLKKLVVGENSSEWAAWFNRRVGMSVLFLATLTYGATIYLVAQAYQIPLDNPSLVLSWFLGVLPLAYVTRSQPMLFLAIILFLAAVDVRIGAWGLGMVLNYDDIYYGSELYYLAYPLYMVLGLMLYALGGLQARFGPSRSYASPFEILGLASLLGALYLLGTYSFFDGGFVYHLDRYFDLEDVPVGFWVILFGATALATAAFVAAVFLQKGQRLLCQTRPYEGLASVLMLLAGYLVVFLPIEGRTLYPILFNFLLLFGIVGLIFAGYFRGEEALINIALVFFGVGVFTRYFEFVFYLMDPPQLFLLAGVILMVGGVPLLLGRRWVLQRM